MSVLYRAMNREAIALMEGRATAKPFDPALHEAGHCVVAYLLGATVRHVTLRPSPCNPGPHTCSHTEDPQIRGAVLWGGAVAERTMAWATHDFERLAELGLHKPGPAFDLAESVIAANGAAVGVISAALREPAREGILFGEEIEALLRPL